MQRKEAPADHSAQIARIAWLVTFVVPLVLAGLLLTVKSAQAEPLSVPVALDADVEEIFEAEIEEVSELAPEEACIEAEEAFEVEELAEIEMEEICEEEQPERGPRGEATNGDAAAEECALRSASANAVTKNDKLKLTIGYTTTEPVNAKVEIKQGGVKLASLSRHLGRSGVLRHTEKLGENEDGKLTVRLKLASGAAGCPSRRLVLFPR